MITAIHRMIQPLSTSGFYRAKIENGNFKAFKKPSGKWDVFIGHRTIEQNVNLMTVRKLVNQYNKGELR